MRLSRRPMALAGVTIAVVVICVGSITAYWRMQSNRLGDMQETVSSFVPPESWVGWTPVGVESNPYSPLCVDVECPSHSERFVVAVPAGDVGAALEAALVAMDSGPVTSPQRACLANERCLYTVDADGFRVDIIVADPFDSERRTVGVIPIGFVEVAVTLHAY